MRTYAPNASHLRRVVLPLTAILIAGPVAAQRQPLVMTHGIRSNASTWDITAFDLGVAFPLSIRRFDTQWTTPYAAQANELLQTSFAGQPDSTLAVGHSNGGLVLRQAALFNAPLRGIATVGSPNFGTPAADAIRKNYMHDIVSPILIHGQAISYGLSPPDPADANEQWYYDYVVASGSNMASLIGSILTFMDFDPSYSIWNSMYPTSPFMQEVNSSSSIALQAQRAPIRASIRTFLNDPHQAFWRLAIAQENVAYFEALRDVAAFVALEAGFYYTDKYCYSQPGNSLKCNASSLFFDMSSDLLLIEGRYCYKLNFEDAAGPYPFPCFASDAVVPFERQMWGASGFAVQYEVEGPAHTEQPRSEGVRNAIESFLQDRANVARCGQGPVYQVQITPQSGDLLLGTTAPLTVVAQDRCPATLVSPPPISSVASSDPSVATASIGTGAVNVSAITNGVATITVVMNGISATRVITVGAGNALSVEILGGPRENLSTGETVSLYANVAPSGQAVTYEWRADGGPVVSTSSAYGHYFQGASTITLTVMNSAGQTAYASAYLSGGGGPLRVQRARPPESGRP